MCKMTNRPVLGKCLCKLHKNESRKIIAIVYFAETRPPTFAGGAPKHMITYSYVLIKERGCFHPLSLNCNLYVVNM